jgi:hypothetical protein
MMDASKVCPKGWHVSYPWMSEDYKWGVVCKRRCRVGLPEYYFIDFEYSQAIQVGSGKTLVNRGPCQFKDVPEILLEKPFDPFPFDVYTLGRSFSEKMKVCLFL